MLGIRVKGGRGGGRIEVGFGSREGAYWSLWGRGLVLAGADMGQAVHHEFVLPLDLSQPGITVAEVFALCLSCLPYTRSTHCGTKSPEDKLDKKERLMW